MNEVEINDQLFKENLFDLFKKQLEKDFESSGLNVDFVRDLTAQFNEMKARIIYELEPLIISNSSLLSSMLYRVDISEAQLKIYQKKNSQLTFSELIAELVIKRVLQKVILKKTFSK